MECNYKSAEWYGEKIQNLTTYIKKKFIDFGFEKAGLLHNISNMLGDVL
jgi:hypothetical protein